MLCRKTPLHAFGFVCLLILMMAPLADAIEFKECDQDQRERNELDEVCVATHRRDDFSVAAVSDADARAAAGLANAERDSDREDSE